MTTSTSIPPANETSRGPVMANEELRQKAIHYTSWACLLAGPIIIALPPRKLDIYTFGLLFCTFIGGNEVSREQTGISMIGRIGQRIAQSTAALPPQAMDIQRRAREERERSSRGIEIRKPETIGISSLKSSATNRDFKEECDMINDKNPGLLLKVWMGGEGENWKEERLQKEREALANGKGYFDLIMEQVLEVWNSEKSKALQAPDKNKEQDQGSNKK